jgi:tetratricopeptide (TPR) repeat protein
MKRILFYLLPLLFLIACNKGKEKEKTNLSPRDLAVSKIDSLETHIRSSVDKQENPDVTLALDAIKHYRYFAADFPQDSLSPDYLFRAAQIYEGVLQDNQEAAEIYGSVYEKYPNYKNRPMMLFHQGNAFIESQDTAYASLYLGRFIREYPDHPFADDAQGLLNMMRMNDAQLQDFLTKARQQPQGSAQPQ